MVHLIVGYGEVGQGLDKVLGGNSLVVDPDKGFMGVNPKGEEPNVVHICIPPIEDFDEVVNRYKKPGVLIIVHSSVAVGTCDRLGVVHSPIRGVHPNMAEGIQTFVKYFGGKDAEKAANIFSELGLIVKVFPEARTTEALKLWDTTQYGFLIMLEKYVHKWCEDNAIDFDAIYTEANRDYNEGYRALGRPEVVRPYLKHYPGKIGGHCVVPNGKLLDNDVDFDEMVEEIENAK